METKSALVNYILLLVFKKIKGNEAYVLYLIQKLANSITIIALKDILTDNSRQCENQDNINIIIDKLSNPKCLVVGTISSSQNQ